MESELSLPEVIAFQAVFEAAQAHGIHLPMPTNNALEMKIRMATWIEQTANAADKLTASQLDGQANSGQIRELVSSKIHDKASYNIDRILEAYAGDVDIDRIKYEAHDTLSLMMDNIHNRLGENQRDVEKQWTVNQVKDAANRASVLEVANIQCLANEMIDRYDRKDGSSDGKIALDDVEFSRLLLNSMAGFPSHNLPCSNSIRYDGDYDKSHLTTLSASQNRSETPNKSKIVPDM